MRVFRYVLACYLLFNILRTRRIPKDVLKLKNEILESVIAVL